MEAGETNLVKLEVSDAIDMSLTGLCRVVGASGKASSLGYLGVDFVIDRGDSCVFICIINHFRP